ncbi:hypothetical protein BJ165DRAFT_1535151 [Panaeolus papilionaceus]|nr:hypothetical protein BJ165DRAFT_1535151 [Panaeolus papilionaceus]
MLQLHSMVHLPLPLLEHSRKFHPPSMLVVLRLQLQPRPSSALVITITFYDFVNHYDSRRHLSSCPAIGPLLLVLPLPSRDLLSLRVHTPSTTLSVTTTPAPPLPAPREERRKEDVKEKDYASVAMANLKPPPLFSPPHPNSVSHIHQHQHRSPLTHLRLVPLENP